MACRPLSLWAWLWLRCPWCVYGCLGLPPLPGHRHLDSDSIWAWGRGARVPHALGPQGGGRRGQELRQHSWWSVRSFPSPAETSPQAWVPRLAPSSLFFKGEAGFLGHPPTRPVLGRGSSWRVGSWGFGGWEVGGPGPGVWGWGAREESGWKSPKSPKQNRIIPAQTGQTF